MKDVKKFLSNLDDDDLLQIINGIGSEIKKRIIDLLKKYGCSSMEFSNDDDVAVSVNDVFDAHKFPEGIYDKSVNIREIGFTNAFAKGEIFKNYLYCNTTNDEVFQGDEINEDSLWDAYITLKDNFLQYEKNRK